MHIGRYRHGYKPLKCIEKYVSSVPFSQCGKLYQKTTMTYVNIWLRLWSADLSELFPVRTLHIHLSCTDQMRPQAKVRYRWKHCLKCSKSWVVRYMEHIFCIYYLYVFEYMHVLWKKIQFKHLSISVEHVVVQIIVQEKKKVLLSHIHVYSPWARQCVTYLLLNQSSKMYILQ